MPLLPISIAPLDLKRNRSSEQNEPVFDSAPPGSNGTFSSPSGAKDSRGISLGAQGQSLPTPAAIPASISSSRQNNHISLDRSSLSSWDRQGSALPPAQSQRHSHSHSHNHNGTMEFGGWGSGSELDTAFYDTFHSSNDGDEDDNEANPTGILADPHRRIHHPSSNTATTAATTNAPSGPSNGFGTSRSALHSHTLNNPSSASAGTSGNAADEENDGGDEREQGEDEEDPTNDGDTIKSQCSDDDGARHPSSQRSSPGYGDLGINDWDDDIGEAHNMPMRDASRSPTGLSDKMIGVSTGAVQDLQQPMQGTGSAMQTAAINDDEGIAAGLDIMTGYMDAMDAVAQSRDDSSRNPPVHRRRQQRRGQTKPSKPSKSATRDSRQNRQPQRVAGASTSGHPVSPNPKSPSALHTGTSVQQHQQQQQQQLQRWLPTSAQPANSPTVPSQANQAKGSVQFQWQPQSQLQPAQEHARHQQGHQHPQAQPRSQPGTNSQSGNATTSSQQTTTSQSQNHGSTAIDMNIPMMAMQEMLSNYNLAAKASGNVILPATTAPAAATAATAGTASSHHARNPQQPKTQAQASSPVPPSQGWQQKAHTQQQQQQQRTSTNPPPTLIPPTNQLTQSRRPVEQLMMNPAAPNAQAQAQVQAQLTTPATPNTPNTNTPDSLAARLASLQHQLALAKQHQQQQQQYGNASPQATAQALQQQAALSQVAHATAAATVVAHSARTIAQMSAMQGRQSALNLAHQGVHTASQNVYSTNATNVSMGSAMSNPAVAGQRVHGGNIPSAPPFHQGQQAQLPQSQSHHSPVAPAASVVSSTASAPIAPAKQPESAATGAPPSGQNPATVTGSPVAATMHTSATSAATTAASNARVSAAPVAPNGKLPPFYLFDAPIELRANFQQNQRRLGIPVPEDCNSFHYGQTVNGFHPQQLLSFNPALAAAAAAAAASGRAGDANAAGLPPTLVASVAAAAAANRAGGSNAAIPPVRLMDARHGTKKGMGRVKNEREQKRAQKITELIDEIRLIMKDGGEDIEVRSKFHTLSSCANYIKKILETNKDKEETNSKLRNELDIKQRKLDEDKAAESRSDPESVESATSSLTTDSQTNKNEEQNQEGIDKPSGKRKDRTSKRKADSMLKDDGDAPAIKKQCPEHASSEDSSGSEERSGSKGPMAQSVSIDKTVFSMSDLTDSNRDSSGNSGSGSGCTDRKDGQVSTENSSPTDIDGDNSEDRQNIASSISSDAAVKSGLDSRDRPGSKHKDVVFSKESKKPRHGRKRPPEEVTSRERVFVLDYEEVFENSNIPQLIAATSGKAVSWNETFLRMTGLRNEDVERMTIFSLVKPENLSNFFEIVAAALRQSGDTPNQAGDVTPSDTTDAGISQHDRHTPIASAQERMENDTSHGPAPKPASQSGSGSNASDQNSSTISTTKSTANGSTDSARKWNYAAMTLPCIEFPAIKKHRKASNPSQNGKSREDLYVTVTLLDDENPDKRCFHCVFTNCPGTNGALGSLTPELLEILFSSPPRCDKNRKHRRHHKLSHRHHHHHHHHRAKHSRKSSLQMTSKVPGGRQDAHRTADSHSTPSSGDTLTDKLPTSSQSGNSSGQDGSNTTAATATKTRIVTSSDSDKTKDGSTTDGPTAGEACREAMSSKRESAELLSSGQETQR